MSRSGGRAWWTTSTVWLVLAIVLGAGRSLAQSPAPRLLRVTARDGAIDAPDSAAAGWTRFHVTKRGDHLVVAFRLRDDVPAARVPAFLAALDTARNTPGTALARGGLEVQATGEIVLDLAPGRYVLACIRRGADGHRHVHAGEARTLTVVRRAASGRRSGTAPAAATELHMLDFAYRSTERWPAGAHWVRVTNEGREDHLVLVARLRDGATLRDWADADDPGRVATPLTGVARMGPGTVAYLPVTMRPGRYVLYCMIPHAGSGKPHVELGMFREVVVDAP
jgi:hypothetical protein